MGDALDIPYANTILIRLLNKGGKGKKSDIITKEDSWTTWSKSIDKLSVLGYLTIEETIKGRRTYDIFLTDKGHQVAEQLLNAELAAKGTFKKSFFSRQQLIIMLLGDRGKLTVGQIKEEIPGSYDDIKELEEMKLVRSEVDNESYPPENYFVLSEKGEEAYKEIRILEGKIKR